MNNERFAIIQYSSAISHNSFNFITNNFDLIFLDKPHYIQLYKNNLSQITLKNIHHIDNHKKFLGSNINSIAIIFDKFNLNSLMSVSGMLNKQGIVLLIFTSPLSPSFISYIQKIALIFNVKFINLYESINYDDYSLLQKYLKQWHQTYQAKKILDHVLDENYHLAAECKTVIPFELTLEQQCVINELKNKITNSNSFIYFLTGARGTGKTTVIRTLLNDLKISPINFCLLDGGEGFISYLYKANNKKIKIITPQNYLKFTTTTDVLIIEEVACIPLSILNNILELFPKIIIVGTLFGYEGSNQGINIKLKKSKQFHSKSLSKNFRYFEDNYENFLKCLEFNFSSPCFQKDLQDKLINIKRNQQIDKNSTPIFFSSNINPELEINVYHFPSILKMNEEEYLKTLGNLSNILKLNHYQTSNQDIIRWINDINCFLFILKKFNADSNVRISQVVSVAIASYEAIIDKKLIKDVFNGVSRPKENLLPQTLLTHAGIKFPIKTTFIRFQRIITIPTHRRQNYASTLISITNDNKLKNFIHKSSSFNNFLEEPVTIFSGVAFALSYDTFNFWKNNDYKPIHIGLKKDKASGECSLVMLKAHSELNNIFLTQWANYFLYIKAPIILKRHNMIHESKILNIPLITTADELISSFIATEKLSKYDIFNHNCYDRVSSMAYFNHSLEHGIVELMIFAELCKDELNSISQNSISYNNSYNILKDFLLNTEPSIIVKKYKLPGVKDIKNNIQQLLQKILELLQNDK